MGILAYIYMYASAYTHKNHHRKIRHFTSVNSRNFRDSNEAIVSSTTFTHTGWDSSPLTPEASQSLVPAQPCVCVTGGAS